MQPNPTENGTSAMFSTRNKNLIRYFRVQKNSVESLRRGRLFQKLKLTTTSKRIDAFFGGLMYIRADTKRSTMKSYFYVKFVGIQICFRNLFCNLNFSFRQKKIPFPLMINFSHKKSNSKQHILIENYCVSVSCTSI